MGNGEAKELVCTTHGHELRWENDGGRKGTGWRGIKGRKNGTIVINKIYLKRAYYIIPFIYIIRFCAKTKLNMERRREQRFAGVGESRECRTGRDSTSILWWGMCDSPCGNPHNAAHARADVLKKVCGLFDSTVSRVVG